MDVFQFFGEQLEYELKDVKSYSPLALAYIGDGAYELAIRSMVIGHGNCSPNRLHKEASSWVSAPAQCEMLAAIKECLTEEELDYFRRGRNAKSGSMAKNASMWEYRRATGYEALMGYLYITGQTARMLELIRIGVKARTAGDAEKRDITIHEN